MRAGRSARITSESPRAGFTVCTRDRRVEPETRASAKDSDFSFASLMSCGSRCVAVLAKSGSASGAKSSHHWRRWANVGKGRVIAWRSHGPRARRGSTKRITGAPTRLNSAKISWTGASEPHCRKSITRLIALSAHSLRHDLMKRFRKSGCASSPSRAPNSAKSITHGSSPLAELAIRRA